MRYLGSRHQQTARLANLASGAVCCVKSGGRLVRPHSHALARDDGSRHKGSHLAEGEVDVPRFLRQAACLNNAQVAELATLALTLEAAMSYPVDIEAAFAGGEIYLLQCRPIMTMP